MAMVDRDGNPIVEREDMSGVAPTFPEPLDLDIPERVTMGTSGGSDRLYHRVDYDKNGDMTPACKMMRLHPTARFTDRHFLGAVRSFRACPDCFENPEPWREGLAWVLGEALIE